MKLLKNKYVVLYSFSLFFLSACSFTGVRKPLYDGEKVEPKKEAIEIYQESKEITGAEKDYYLRYPFSEDIYNESLAYPEEEPVLLLEGEYVVGEDLPAGRVSLLGNESIFSSDSYEVHVGNLTIRDGAGDVYFENLFHSEYGQQTAQVDLIKGHTLTIVGTDAEVTAFYTENFPKDPYTLMSPPAVLENLGRLEVKDPIELQEHKDVVNLTAGIYEVGVHLDPGLYEIESVRAPHNTELYLFREKGEEEPHVFELPVRVAAFDDEEEEVSEAVIEEKAAQIELKEKDKIYPNLVEYLQLKKINKE